MKTILEALRRTAVKNTEIDYENGRYVTRFGNNFQEDLNEEIDRLNTNKKEKKLPEKIDLAWQNAFDEQVQQDCIKMICENINEIIDYLKSKGE